MTTDLKITGVEAIYLRLPEVKTQCDSGQDALIVKVTTDAGITGYGEVDSNPMAVKGCIEGPFSHTTATGLAHVVIGEDPFRDRVPLAQDVPGQYLWRPARDRHPRDERHRPGPLGHQGEGPGTAGLEAARGRVHASRCGPMPARSSARRPPRPASGRDGSPTRGSRPSSSAGTRWARTARPTSPWCARHAPGLGPKLDLMIDAGLVYDAKTAIQRARAFEQYDPFWFEEPLLPDDYEGYAKLAAATSLRIAAGEEESERKSFLQLMDVGKIDVVQVDLTRCGGFTEAIKIAALAADRGLPVVNHGFTTYLNVAAALHFLASIPNTLGLLEFVVEEGTTLRQSITRDHPRRMTEWSPSPTRRAWASSLSPRESRSSGWPERRCRRTSAAQRPILSPRPGIVDRPPCQPHKRSSTL